MIFINSYEEEINVDEILESFRIITEAFEDVDDIIGFCEENGFSDDDSEKDKERIQRVIDKLEILDRNTSIFYKKRDVE